MTSMLKTLDLGIQWIGRDGEPELRSNLEPGLIAQVQEGISNVGWGEGVKFDLTPRDAAGKELGAADTRYPTISWRAWIDPQDGTAAAAAQLNADPEKEGEVDLGSQPLHFATKPYDDAKGYALRIIAGRRKGNGDYKPAADGQVFVHVYAFDVVTGVRSNTVKYAVS